MILSLLIELQHYIDGQMKLSKNPIVVDHSRCQFGRGERIALTAEAGGFAKEAAS